MEEICFQNFNYPIREITLPKVGNVLISTTALNKVLMINGGRYRSIEASNIDEKIYYFVEEREMVLSDSELSNLVLMQTL